MDAEQASVNQICKTFGLAFRYVRTEGNQVIVKPSELLPITHVGREGHALMLLEKLLNADGDSYEVYFEARKDENKLRLQTLDKVKDWQKRRDEVKHEPPAA